MAASRDRPTRRPPARETPPPRVLFLDDDPRRAEIFLTEHPHAVWVQTVADCLARLEEPWDEVHLDHDLGGEQYVEHERDDCGMEVVRWLCLEPRPHLAPTRFLVHSHNPTGAKLMGMQMMVNGYRVEVRPFGSAAVDAAATLFQGSAVPDVRHPLLKRLRGWLVSLIRPRDRGLTPEVLKLIRERREQIARAADDRAASGESPAAPPPA